MTKPSHQNGTSRCYEVYNKIKNKKKIDAIVNIQGDEPLVHREHFDLLIDAIKDPHCDIATLAIDSSSQEKSASDVFVTRNKKNMLCILVVFNFHLYKINHFHLSI